MLSPETFFNSFPFLRSSSIKEEGSKKIFEIEIEGKKEVVEGTDILVATGRSPNARDIGLDSVNVETDSRGFVKVNEYMQTTNENVYAAGDCIGKMMLVTVAAVEGGVAAQNALLGNQLTVDYLSIPHAVFTEPEFASVGLKEEDARKKGFGIETRILEFTKVPRAQISFRTRV